MQIDLAPAQFDVLVCEEPVAALVGGVGGGKSFTLAHFALQQVTSYPGVPGLVVANTYSQILNATVPAITGLLSELDIPYELTMSGARKRVEFLGTIVYIYSLEQYDNIRGIQVGWVAGDEMAFACREAINVVLGRLRDKRGSLKARWFTSPNGFNFWYDYITEQKISEFKIRTKDNVHLPKQYYNQLVELYGGENSPLARQELFGEYVNLTSGSVYFAFDRMRHVRPISDDIHQPIYVGCDFNVANMNFVAIQYDKYGFKVIDAINLKDSAANTYSMAYEIYSRYGRRAIVVPDSTGVARKTSAEVGITDIRILKNAGLNVETTNNPRIKDRQNSVNTAFLKNRLTINSHCGTLIKEIETLSNDADEGDVSHLAVAMGYVIWKLEPITIHNKTSGVTNPFLKGANRG